ncbi:kinesin-like protein KIF18A isoform X2 [Macrosteles quadrilineatus]|nr:kinesin-like protein KIF18A isoform X2 [Macrosteles quadrilineatus]
MASTTSNKRALDDKHLPKPKMKKVMGSGTNSLPPKKPSSIKVFVRVRPFNNQENSQNMRNIIKVIDDRILIFDPKEESEGFFFHGVKQKSRDIAKKQNKDMEFAFDRVFSGISTNEEVYQETTKGIITTLLDGYNCSVFVYGATGAGKTHTMLGSKQGPGIIFLTMTELYSQIDQLKETKNIEIGISYLEVYNENVHDLINPRGSLQLRDDSSGGVLVAGMKVEKILCADQLFQLLQKGNSNRTQHPTDANAESSRSHAVFQVYVKSSAKDNGELKISKLSMIDLAGSERGSATGGVKARFKEGSNINKSLLALGNCINNLADGLRHIPYRDSKLTRLLKDSLGGNCFTVMIANIAPTTASYEDTYNTLKYATRAKAIKTALSKNVSVNLSIEYYAQANNNLRRELAEANEKMRLMENAMKHPVTSPPRADPKFSARLSELYRDKEQIYAEYLYMEGQVKLLQWRMRCKNRALNQIRNFGTNEDLTVTENSLAQLNARSTSLVEKMAEVWQRRELHQEEYNKFVSEMDLAKVTKLLQPEASLKEAQCELAGVKIQLNHCLKIINMQDKRLEDLQAAVDTVSAICSEYHQLLNGLNMVTDNMNNTYQQGLAKIKGLKAVKWLDFLEDHDEEDKGVTLSSVSVRPFINLTLGVLNSSTPPFMVAESRPKLVPESHKPATEPLTFEESSNMNGTFVLDHPIDEPENQEKSRKTSFILPKVPSHTMTAKVPLRKFTPARPRFANANRENMVSKLAKKTLPSTNRLQTALREINNQMKTPETTVSLNGYKITREKQRIHRNNVHHYVTPKLKRLGSTPTSTTKISKGLKI